MARDFVNTAARIATYDTPRHCSLAVDLPADMVGADAVRSMREKRRNNGTERKAFQECAVDLLRRTLSIPPRHGNSSSGFLAV